MDAFMKCLSDLRFSLRNLLGRYGVLTNPCSTEQEILDGLAGLLARRQTELDEDHLIFITEVMVLAHSRITLLSSSLVVTLLYSNGMDDMLQESLRKLLRVSLQYPSFRKKFNEHFAAHPLREIREEGQQWLSKILVWEE